MVFTFYVLDGKQLFLTNLVQKIKLKLKFGTEPNSNMQDSMVVFTFSVSDGEQPFSTNLDQKMKIVSLR